MFAQNKACVKIGKNSSGSLCAPFGGDPARRILAALLLLIACVCGAAPTPRFCPPTPLPPRAPAGAMDPAPPQAPTPAPPANLTAPSREVPFYAGLFGAAVETTATFVSPATRWRRPQIPGGFATSLEAGRRTQRAGTVAQWLEGARSSLVTCESLARSRRTDEALGAATEARTIARLLIATAERMTYPPPTATMNALYRLEVLSDILMELAEQPYRPRMRYLSREADRLARDIAATAPPEFLSTTQHTAR